MEEEKKVEIPVEENVIEIDVQAVFSELLAVISQLQLDNALLRVQLSGVNTTEEKDQ